MTVIDTGIQHGTNLLPEDTGLGSELHRALILGIENLAESYVADAIIGAPKDTDSLLANALGTAVGSFMLDYDSAVSKASSGKQTYQDLLRAKLGEPSIQTGLPIEPDAWQMVQAMGMQDLRNTSNRPVMSTNQVRSQPQTAADEYQGMINAVNIVQSYLTLIQNAGSVLSRNAAINQQQGTPTDATHAVNGGIESSRGGHSSEISDAAVAAWLLTSRAVASFGETTFQGMYDVVRHPIDTIKSVGELALDIGNAENALFFGLAEAPDSLARNATRLSTAKGALFAVKTDFTSCNWAGIGADIGIAAAMVIPFGGEVKDLEMAGEVGRIGGAGKGRELVAGSGVKTLENGVPQIGQKVYRVWGDEAGSYGRSWTRTDPSTIPNYRSEAGLPNQNTGRFISEGKLTNTQGVQGRNALPLHGYPGGLDELLIPHPREQIELENVSGMNPKY